MYEKSLFNPLLLLAGLLVSNLSVAQVTPISGGCRTRNKHSGIPQMVYNDVVPPHGFRSTKPIYEMGRFEFMFETSRPAKSSNGLNKDFFIHKVFLMGN